MPVIQVAFEHTPFTTTPDAPPRSSESCSIRKQINTSHSTSSNIPSQPASLSPSISTTNTFDLKELLRQYSSQPSLLKLILTSKVEEDKRRTEEAKVRVKELDLYLRQRQLRAGVPQSRHPVASLKNHPGTSSEDEPWIVSQTHSRNSRYHTRSMHYAMPYPNHGQRHSTTQKCGNWAMEQRRNSAAAAMVAMAGSVHSRSPSPPSSPTLQSSRIPSIVHPSGAADLHCTSTTSRAIGLDTSRPRRRREMQAITRIVETCEFPYDDGFFWKNNGNTTQKKTGCKSIYYKCSNASKGCTVNKTVTAKPSGEYLIKYRGVHLAECSGGVRVQGSSDCCYKTDIP